MNNYVQETNEVCVYCYIIHKFEIEEKEGTTPRFASFPQQPLESV